MVNKAFLLLIVIGLYYSNVANAVDSIAVKVETVKLGETTVSNLGIDIDLRKANQYPSLDLSATLQHPVADAGVRLSLQCMCMVPTVTQKALQCNRGNVNATGFNFPFTLSISSLADGFHGQLNTPAASFSNQSGLHAGEDISASLDFTIRKLSNNFYINGSLDWIGGEIYWDPYYLEGDRHKFKGDFIIKNDRVSFNRLVWDLNSVGRLNLEGEYDLKQNSFTQLSANLPDLDLSKAFPLLFKPMLQQSILQQTDLSGRVDLSASVAQSQLKSFDLRLHDVSVKDQQQHFAFEHINAHIPWDYDVKQTVTLSYQQGQLRSLPLGEANIELEVNRYAWTAPKITMPILDGALELKNLSAARLGGRWHWHLGADIQNLGMPQLSEAFGWPTMQGSASVHIPLVTYSNASLLTDGEMVFKVFNGETTVSHLALQDPLGNAPRLSADLSMRALDLGQLTETFSFGSIEGKLDGDVNGLVLQNWQPVAFDASFISSPGRYRKKISQRAVENISALGGAGAVAAIQRSVLRFFEAFNYAKIGISCRLARDICTMAGLPDDKTKSTDEGYLIVKGRGIPAISVKGFNRTVGWDDLLSRVQRITNENTEAIVR